MAHLNLYGRDKDVTLMTDVEITGDTVCSEYEGAGVQEAQGATRGQDVS